jgi:hypothetical protein
MRGIIRSKNKKASMRKYAVDGGFYGAEVAIARYGMDRATILDIIENMDFTRVRTTRTARKRVVNKIVERARMLEMLSGERPSSGYWTDGLKRK